jgi:3-hydroxybutyryl-CoA dehydrogenase
MSDVLLVGESRDPLLQEFQKRCQEMAYPTLIWDPRSEVLPALLDGISDVMVVGFYHSQVMPQDWLSQVNTRLSSHSVVLACGWQGTATAMAALLPMYSDQLLSFSPLGLYRQLDAIEVASGLQTSEASRERALTFLEGLGFSPLLIQDSPGMVFPRVLASLVNEAVSALMEGVATPEDIDTAMKLGTNYPEGPLAWADLVGLDVILAILTHLYEEYQEDRYRPMPLLKQKVLAGQLGQKTGQGFFAYQDQPISVSF